jgi:5-oxoprolinase (ATP-hydrolysing) subunit C
MSMRVLSAGLLTTLQDAGRTGSRALGVGRAGALDPYSHAVANLLVGNAADAPTLEITLAGPRLRFERAARIAVCGARIDASLEGAALPMWRPVTVPAGSTLRLGACREGARAYVAASGGFRVAPVLGSASTDLRGGFGGIEGRALVAGDMLDFATTVELPALPVSHWWIDPRPDVVFAAPQRIRVLAGADATRPAGALFSRTWQVASASDRQGLRLQGEPVQRADAGERISEPVSPGTVQLPADGLPIVLLADAQTHGGYPRIGHAIQADWPRLAQLRAGDRLRFLPCTHAEALQARHEQAQRLARIALAIGSRAGDG